MIFTVNELISSMDTYFGRFVSRIVHWQLALAKQLQVRDDERQSEQRMAQAADAARLGMWEWDIDRDEIWVTQRGRELFGFAPGERVDLERFLNAFHPDDRDALRRGVARTREHGGSFENAYRAMLPDGQTRWIATRGDVQTGAGGEVRLVHGVSYDVTERMQVEDALRESERSFRTMADTAPVMIWMTGTDRLCSFVSKGWLDFTGRTLEQESGNGWAQEMHRDDFGRCHEAYANAFNARESFSMEYRLRRSDGEYRWLLHNGVPRQGPDGEFLGYIGSVIDITERTATDNSARKRAQLEIEQQRSELAHLSRVTMLGELSGSLAHELNQPLTAILSNAQAAQRFLVRDDADIDEVREILQDIVSDDKRAGEIIRGVRLLLKKGKMQTQPLDLNDAVRDVLTLVRSEMLNGGIVVSTELAPGLPMVNGDRVQLQQVLLNLVMNGSDAMAGVAATERRLIVRTAPVERKGIRVSIADQGHGIALENLERVFEPFFTTKTHGLGLGLAVCRNIVTAHGGRLWATRNAGRGASFHFTVGVSS